MGGRDRHKDGRAEGITAWLGMVRLWVGLVLGLIGWRDVGSKERLASFCFVLIYVVVKTVHLHSPSRQAELYIYLFCKVY